MLESIKSKSRDLLTKEQQSNLKGGNTDGEDTIVIPDVIQG